MRKILLAGASLMALAVATPAIAADLRPMATKAPPMVAYAPFSWTGFYVGFNAGYGFGGDNEVETRGIDDDDDDFRSRFGDLEREGFIGGLQLGYNWQVNNIVFGLETDIQYTDLEDERTQFRGGDQFRSSYSQHLEFLGTFRGRLGLAFDRTLLYITGGLAYGGVDNEVDFRSGGITAFRGREDDIRVGYTIGGGLEYAVTNNISLKAEYLYYDLGEDDVFAGVRAPFTGRGYFSEFRNDGHIIRGGINFRFGAPAAPVMARY